MARLGKFDAAVGRLSAGGANIRCSEMRSILASLGFRVENGRKGNHKLFYHDNINTFKAGNYNCGHGSDNELLKIYVKNVLDAIVENEEELRMYLGEESK